MIALLALFAKIRAAVGSISPLVVIEIATIASLPLVYHCGHGRGEKLAHAEDAAKADAALAEMNKRYREREATHAQQIVDVRLEYARKSESEAATDRGVAASFGDGTRRLRVPVTRRCPIASAPASAPTGVDGPSTAELTPAAATALYAIAADGDRYARQLTALQAWVRSAVQLCNGK